MKLIDEVLEHLFLGLEDLDVSVTFLLDLLWQVKGQRLLVQLPKHSETLKLFLLCGSILINFVLDNA